MPTVYRTSSIIPEELPPHLVQRVRSNLASVTHLKGLVIPGLPPVLVAKMSERAGAVEGRGVSLDTQVLRGACGASFAMALRPEGLPAFAQVVVSAGDASFDILLDASPVRVIVAKGNEIFHAFVIFGPMLVRDSDDVRAALSHKPILADERAHIFALVAAWTAPGLIHIRAELAA